MTAIGFAQKVAGKFMTGTNYWATGIAVECIDGDYWRAYLDFYDGGFRDGDSTEGRLKARYNTLTADLKRVVGVLKADAEKIGIEFKAVKEHPHLYIIDSPVTVELEEVAESIDFKAVSNEHS